MMKKSEWYDVLEPREAVIAGLVGLAVVWPLTYYAYDTGYYVFWGLSPSQWKAIGTAIGKSIYQRERTISSAEQQSAGIRADRATIKTRNHFASFNGCKSK